MYTVYIIMNKISSNEHINAVAINFRRNLLMIMDRIALILAIIGGLNWGSIGIFRFDMVAYICGGQTSTLSRVIYTLVGLAAIWCISLLFREKETVDDNV